MRKMKNATFFILIFFTCVISLFFAAVPLYYGGIGGIFSSVLCTKILYSCDSAFFYFVEFFNYINH